MALVDTSSVPPPSRGPTVVRDRVPTSTGGVATMNLGRLRRHEEKIAELDTGKDGLPLLITVTCAPDYPGLGPVPEDVTNAAEIIVYGTDKATRRICDFRFQERIPAYTPADAPPPVMQFASVEGLMRFAFFAPVPLRDVVLTARAGTAVPRPVTIYDDFFSLWRIAKMYNVNTENYALVVRWFERHRTALILQTTRLVHPETGETPLHVLCAACGDPRLAKLFLKHCCRFINPNAEANDGATAVLRLLQHNTDACNPRSHKYFRALELLHLLVDECAVSLDKQDAAGETVLHHACRGHRRGSKVLPTLLDAGAALFAPVRSEEGFTAAVVATLESSGLDPSEVVEVEKLMSKPVQGTRVRTLPQMDRLPQLTNEAAIGVDEAPPSAVETDDLGQPIVVGGRPKLSEKRLREEFARLDVDGNGWLSATEVKRVYRCYDQAGVVPTEVELDMLVESLGIMRDGRVTFDEFVLLVLKLSRR